MESGSSNEDDEPKVCTVFSSDGSSSRTVFDSIAFTSSPRKPEEPAKSSNKEDFPSVNLFKMDESFRGQQEDIFDSLSATSATPPVTSMTSPVTSMTQVTSVTSPIQQDQVELKFEELKDTTLDSSNASGDQLTKIDQSDFPIQSDLPDELSLKMKESLVIEEEIPEAKSIFADAPDIPFPVNIGVLPPVRPPPFNPQIQQPSYFEPSTQFSKNNIFEPLPVAPIVKSEYYNPNLNMPQPSNSYLATEGDLTYDAWIPPPELQLLLESIVKAKKDGSYLLNQSHLTMPGIIYQDDMVDKVRVNMSRIFGESEASKRVILTADSVTQDDSGLRELIKLGCYRSGINLTKRLLNEFGQGIGKVGSLSRHTPLTLQIWFTRISLLIRTREFGTAEAEIDAFKNFDSPDMFYQFYGDEYEGRRGTMVPFNFRLLAAEVPQFMRKTNDSMDKLQNILFTVKEIINNLEKNLAEDGQSQIEDEKKEKNLVIWRKREIRVYYALLNCAILAKDYRNAVNTVLKLCDMDPNKKCELASLLGRIFVQSGDLTSAERSFKTAASLRENNDSEESQVNSLIDAGQFAIANGSYEEAFALFKQALLLQPDNYMLMNNMGVCLLYMGKVKDCLNLMESTVKQNTPELLQENVILNLSTLYELENSDGSKKNGLLKMISEYKGDGINLASLKMPNLI